MKYYFILVLFSINIQAKVIYPNLEDPVDNTSKKEIILNSIYDEIFKRVKHLEIKPPVKEYKRENTGSPNNGERGKLIIEKLKQKNRERLARMRGQDPTTVKSGKDIVSHQKKENKNLIKSINEQRKKQEDNYADIPLELRRSKKWQESAKKELELIKRRVLIEHREWKKKYISELKKLAVKQNEFQGKKADYKKAISEIPLILPVSKKKIQKKVEVKVPKSAYIVSGAMNVEIRDQHLRPTCSAFAGIRLMEVLLAQNTLNWNLSEQFFYWASKKDCQKKRCSRKGSWVGHGIDFDQSKQRPSIPLEKDCPYISFNKKNNETQIPLNDGCKKGKVGINEFSYHETLDEVMKVLDKGLPVIASLKLSPNFYKNNGLILNSEKNIGGEKDSHSGGHAVVFVGYVKLPKALNEGSVCFLTANSWGKGWGIGGHSCLSEKWILEHRKSNPFVTIDALEII